MIPVNSIICGAMPEATKVFPDGSFNCCISSPPYWALRDYGVDGQLGLEKTFEEYIDKLCTIYDEVKRVLRDDGTCWVNLGDTYNNVTPDARDKIRWPKQSRNDHTPNNRVPPANIKAKSLCLIPQRFAIEMVNRGWILRNVIIWHKPNPKPSSAKDRFTVDFEYIFFFVKAKEKSNDIKQWLDKPLAKYDATWFAAMLDAEGTIGINQHQVKGKQNRYTAYLSIANSNRQILEKCQKLVGFGNIYERKQDGHCRMYDWRIGNHRVSAVLAEIYPYLIAKQEQAKVAIALQKTNHRRGSPKGSNRGSAFMTKEELQYKHKLYELIKSLNQKQIESSGLPEPNLNRMGGCEKYWFEPQYEPYLTESNAERPRMGQGNQTKYKQKRAEGMGGAGTSWKGHSGNLKADGSQIGNPALGRNKRTVWTIPTQSFPEAHFATFPEKLVEPMIKAGCPEFVCTKCGKARVPIYEPSEQYKKRLGRSYVDHNDDDIKGCKYRGDIAGRPCTADYIKKGYTDCGCNAEWRPGIVLDCFLWVWDDLTGSYQAAA